MPDAELARRDGVELVRTGSWPAMTGSWTPSRDDLASAIKALECPAVRRPVLKVGHLDDRFTAGDGEPAIGWVDNLRTADSGHTLVGDYVGMPAWIGQIMASAWPDRSIEGDYDYRCTLGHTHPFALKAVALLGVTPPAVGTLKSLQDVADLYGVNVAASDQGAGEHVQVTVRAADLRPGDGNAKALERYWTEGPGLAKWRADPHPWTALYHHLLKYLPEDEAKRTAADWYHKVFGHWPGETHGVHAAEGKDATPMSRAQQIRDAWNASDRPYSQWVAEARPDAAVVVDDVDRSYQLYPVTWNGDDPMFGEPQPYTPAQVLVFASRAESRPEPQDPEVADAPDGADPAAAATTVADSAAPVPASTKQTVQVGFDGASGDPFTDAFRSLIKRQYSGDPNLPAAEPEQVNNPDPKEDLVSTELSGLRSRLGLADDADLTAIEAKVDELKTKADTQPSPEAVAASAAVQAEKTELETTVTKMGQRLEELSTELAAVKAKEAATVKASVLDAALKDGKFAPADRQRWEADYDEAPAVATRILASIAPGTAVPVAASGTAGSPEPSVGFSDDDLTDAFFGPGSAKKFQAEEV